MAAASVNPLIRLVNGRQMELIDFGNDIYSNRHCHNSLSNVYNYYLLLLDSNSTLVISPRGLEKVPLGHFLKAPGAWESPLLKKKNGSPVPLYFRCVFRCLASSFASAKFCYFTEAKLWFCFCKVISVKLLSNFFFWIQAIVNLAFHGVLMTLSLPLRLAMNRVARFWTISKLCTVCLSLGSHTVQAYSSTRWHKAV